MIAIVGAGIGGLAAARALLQTGAEVAVYERSPDVGRAQVVGGFHMWGNAMRALQALGLAEAVQASGTPLERSEFRTWRGDLLASWPVGEMGRELGAADTGVNRRELHRVLLDSLPPGTVRAGKRLAGLAHDEAGVTARFEDGEEVRASVLVGADGIGSRVRELLLGVSPPRYAGYAQFQTWTDRAPDLLAEGTEQVVFGPASRAVLHHVGPGRLFWAGIIYGPRGAAATSNADGSNKAMLLDHFRAWRGPIVQAIGATPAQDIVGLDVYDRAPVRTWGAGRVSLLGDAAHPMTTNLSQGGCQALEDAVVLARSLERSAGDPAAGLRAYERQRRPRTTGLVKRSKRVSAVGAWSSPLACGLRDRVLGKVLSGPGLKEHRTFVSATLA